MSLCAPLTDPTSVRDINGSTLEDNQISPFIQAAAVVIGQVTVCATAAGVDANGLAVAEAWLTCHLMAVTAVGQKDKVSVKESEKFENYSVKWATGAATGEGVMATHYGQMANTLTNGCLQEAGMRNFGLLFAGANC